MVISEMYIKLLATPYELIYIHHTHQAHQVAPCWAKVWIAAPTSDLGSRGQSANDWIYGTKYQEIDMYNKRYCNQVRQSSNYIWVYMRLYESKSWYPGEQTKLIWSSASKHAYQVLVSHHGTSPCEIWAWRQQIDSKDLTMFLWEVCNSDYWASRLYGYCNQNIFEAKRWWHNHLSTWYSHSSARLV